MRSTRARPAVFSPTFHGAYSIVHSLGPWTITALSRFRYSAAGGAMTVRYTAKPTRNRITAPTRSVRTRLP